MFTATHCIAFQDKELSFIDIACSTDANDVRVIHGRTGRIIELGCSPSDGSCPRHQYCQTCNSAAQLFNMLAYEPNEWWSWLTIHVRELEEQGLINMTRFRPAASDEERGYQAAFLSDSREASR